CSGVGRRWDWHTLHALTRAPMGKASIHVAESMGFPTNEVQEWSVHIRLVRFLKSTVGSPASSRVPCFLRPPPPDDFLFFLFPARRLRKSFPALKVSMAILKSEQAEYGLTIPELHLLE